jgi:hypothetical protein
MFKWFLVVHNNINLNKSLIHCSVKNILYVIYFVHKKFVMENDDNTLIVAYVDIGMCHISISVSKQFNDTNIMLKNDNIDVNRSLKDLKQFYQEYDLVDIVLIESCNKNQIYKDDITNQIENIVKKDDIFDIHGIIDEHDTINRENSTVENRIIEFFTSKYPNIEVHKINT